MLLLFLERRRKGITEFGYHHFMGVDERLTIKDKEGEEERHMSVILI